MRKVVPEVDKNQSPSNRVFSKIWSGIVAFGGSLLQSVLLYLIVIAVVIGLLFIFNEGCRGLLAPLKDLH
jgi:hypothetical protein